MNKILHFALFVICIFFRAELYSQVDFQGGIRGGLVSSQVSGDGLAGWNKFGGAAGAFVQMGFNERSSVSFEILYANKGSRKPANADNDDFNTFTMKLNYIEVPITYNYRRNNVQFDLGLYAGVLTGSEIEFNEANYSIEPAFNTTDIGALGGVHWLASEKLSFILRASSSILPIRPAPNPVQKFSYYEQGQYNQALYLLIGYSF
ncbi:MAG: outer membrane beta-barrel protein [Flavobacteriales bacterium]|nr:outer membrane beta-barrel protein [Flavobacteriales bacterium]